MPPLTWYWHRLRAMEPVEIVAQFRKAVYQRQDTRRLPDWGQLNLDFIAPSSFPVLPKPEAAPAVVREALAHDAKEILAGRWRAFGHLEIQVDDPPRWHKDYLAGQNVATDQSAFKLDHRELPGGADIKLIWELSRWHPLARLAMAGHVLGDQSAACQGVEWLADWAMRNPPYRGWNWTSALEAGLRLAQFAWIDALLNSALPARGPGTESKPANGRRVSGDALDSRDAGELLRQLRRIILPAHVWFTWRYRSFGSSANNHLLGELSGLILAVARWPDLAGLAAPLDELQRTWEREVLKQFADDGGNREQALNYHWFSWEFCWQARGALAASGRGISPAVEERLGRAARFFWEIQARREPWDYGDSDNGFVTPLFARERSAPIEWRDWLSRATTNAGAALDYWLGDPPKFSPPLGRGAPVHTAGFNPWSVYPESGLGICESGFWWLRWDLSPLGYLKTAAHGHLDALHLSIWFHGVAIVIDPGTGAYYTDKNLRTWLASAEAHNGPAPRQGPYPVRLGPFLWSGRHERVRWRAAGAGALVAELPLAAGSIRRRVTQLGSQDGWQVEDAVESRTGSAGFAVRWQFAPGAYLKLLSERKLMIKRDDLGVIVEVGSEWDQVVVGEQMDGGPAPARAERDLEARFAGTVSPVFRKVEWAPFLKLVATPRGKTCVFRTTFLACHPA
jgi:hypothetical protein